MHYDRSSLETLCRSWLTHGENTPALFHEIFRFARVRAGAVFRRRPADAQDLSSYFVEKLWVYWNRPDFRPEPWMANPLACLNQFFQSRALEFLRSRRRGQAEVACEDLLEAQPATRAIGPEDVVLREEVRLEVQRKVDLLPAKLRQVYEVRYGRDLPARQAAQSLGWNVPEVYRATAELKRRVRGLLPETPPGALARPAA